MELNTREEEIDLLNLLAKAILGIYKNIALYLIFISLGIASVLGYHKIVKKPTWSTQMMVSVSLLSVEEAKFLLKDFRLDSPAIAKNILSVSTDATSNKVTNEVFLTLTVKTSTPNDFDAIRNVLINYINSSNPITRKRNERTVYNKIMIENAERDIQYLEKVNDQGGAIRVHDLNELHERIAQCKIAINDTTSVELVKSFSPEPSRSNLAILLLAGAAAGALLAAGFTGIKSFIKYVRQIQKTQVG